VCVNHRNRLRIHGQLDKADVLAKKINTLISYHRAHCLNLVLLTTKELWAAVNKTRNAWHNDGLAILHNTDTVNNYFATIACEENYDLGNLTALCECDDNDYEPLTNFKVEQL